MPFRGYPPTNLKGAALIEGLELPFLTEAHPDLLGEGNLDPLGLVRVADRLAEELMPDMTARMQRVRFLTWIAAGAHAIEALRDVPAADRVTTPEIALEWNLVELFARRRGLPPEATQRLPGIVKARSVVSRNSRLDAPSYLRAPRVFGFFGVYRRLARGLDLIDDHDLLLTRGEHLLRSWEVDTPDIEGFVDRRRGTPGGYLVATLETATRRALLSGQATESLYGIRERVVQAFRLDSIGRGEQRVLMDGLRDPLKSSRREMIDLLRRHDRGGTEAEALAAMRHAGTPRLRATIDAISAYERLSGLLMGAFAAAQVVSTSQGWTRADKVARHRAVGRATRDVPTAFRSAVSKVDAFGVAVELDILLGDVAMAAERGSESFVDALMLHHELVQANKPPGKRPWFERSERGYYVRPPYRLEDASLPDFIHPYRIDAARRFLEDLR
jgi:hypothetical protein